MKRSWMIGTVVLFGLIAGCDGDPQLIEPANRGQRGEACTARNDCESGLACVMGVCSKNDFQISVTAKQCDQIDCSVDQDCCGDKPLVAPARCNNRDSVCATPYLADCDRFGLSCTADNDCGSGTCGSGTCSGSNAFCDSDTPCAPETCVGATYCSISGYSCTTSIDCATSNVCVNRDCDCTNPVYDPSDAICTDPDCTDICTQRCSEERCVVDDSCTDDLDCRFGVEQCDNGRCVECVTNDDCDPDTTKVCREGACVEPCTVNEQCLLFHSCDVTTGECVETGCNSDRECVLAASTDGSFQDARLSKCLPSDEDPTIKTCKIPCENDSACPREFEVCSKGFCTFIGCDNNEECRAYLGLEAQQMTPSHPYISTAECRL